MKKRWLIPILIFAAILTAGIYLGAKVALYITTTPECNLSDIEFAYAVGQEERMPIVEVFFVTSRKLLSEQDVTFADEDGERLYFGVAKVRIPAGLRIGDIQVPEIARHQVDEQHATISELKLLSEDEFYGVLSHRLQGSNAKSINLLVHGVNHTFDSSVRQAGTLTFDLNMSFPLVLYSWPTGPGVMPGTYKRDRAAVTGAAQGLDLFLERFQDHIHPRKINILAHSLGCKVVCETFDLLVKKEKWSDAETEMANVVLAAPDVDKDDFDKTFIKEVASLAGRVTVYVASNDGVLVLSSFLNGADRAGVREQQQFAIEELVTKDAKELPRIQIIDATFVNNALTQHSYYYQSRPAFSDVYNLLRNDLPAEDRHVLRHEMAKDANYWIIPP